VYWDTVAWIPKGILDRIKNVSLGFLWLEMEDQKSMVLASWKKLATPKNLGGYGINNILIF
jgi:hypothetical protein